MIGGAGWGVRASKRGHTCFLMISGTRLTFSEEHLVGELQITKVALPSGKTLSKFLLLRLSHIHTWAFM